MRGSNGSISMPQNGDAFDGFRDFILGIWFDDDVNSALFLGTLIYERSLGFFAGATLLF